MVTGFPSSAPLLRATGRWDVLPCRYERLVPTYSYHDANRADIKHHAIEVGEKIIARKML